MITQEQVKKLFTYSHGDLIRLITVSNAVKGSIVGSRSTSGHLNVRAHRREYRVHQLVFLYHHGYIPKEIDHINGIRDDNRIENLRECTRSQNQYNSIKRKNTTSKYKGVHWNSARRMWMGQLGLNKKQIYLGLFDDEETAAQVVQIARIKHHGEFANHGGAL